MTAKYVPADHCATCSCPPVRLTLGCGCDPDAHPNDADGWKAAHPEWPPLCAGPLLPPVLGIMSGRQ